MATVLVHIKMVMEKQPAFGSTQWVTWFRDDAQTWTAYCHAENLVSTGHHCGVFVGMRNGTADCSYQGTVISVAPAYRGQGEWEWSTHLECDVPPLSDMRPSNPHQQPEPSEPSPDTGEIATPERGSDGVS